VAAPLFDATGGSSMGPAPETILQRIGSWDCMTSAHKAVWQVPSQAVFTALFHMTAGAAACAELPPGVFVCGGAVTAALAVPAFDDRESRIDFDQLHLAGKAVGRHLAAARAWRRLAGKLPPWSELVGAFCGFDKAQLASTVEGILRAHGLIARDDWTDVETYDDDHYGRDGNWTWWLSNWGLGAYARTDVDFYITGASLEETSRRADALKKELRDVLGEHVAVKTPNTLTFCLPFPGRHVQIVLTAHVDLASVMLFADLDSTAAAFDGRRVWGSGRFLRALRLGANVIPEGMWELRDDTLIRAAKYVSRGFAACLGSVKPWHSYPAEARKQVCWLARMKPAYFLAEADDLSPLEMSLELEMNTAYSEYKLPRGPGVTPEVVAFFLRQKGAEAKLEEGRAILRGELPLRCEWRLDRKPENWMLWGFSGAQT